jgi:hypothetical protein
MLMVYLVGLGACVSFYFMYRNKHKISFELLKYYTYIDEYISQYSKTHESIFLYPSNENDILCETTNLQTAIININQSGFDYVISKDFIVDEKNGKNNKKSKLFYSIFTIDKNKSFDLQLTCDNDNELINILKTTNDKNITSGFDLENGDKDDDLINIDEQDDEEHDENLSAVFGLARNEPIPKIELGVKLNAYYEYLENLFFKNKVVLFNEIYWNPPIIAASINIIDSNNIYTFREYDISTYLNSMLRKDEVMELNNEISSKKLWIYLFNYFFKDKNINIPCQKEDLHNYEISWTIIFDDCNVLEGSNLKIDLRNK